MVNSELSSKKMAKNHSSFKEKLVRFRKRILGTNAKDIIFNSFLYLFFILFVLVMLSPFIYVILTSFKTQSIVDGISTTKYDLSAYIYVLSSKNIVRSFLNTIFVTIIEVILSVVVTAIAAYPLALRKLKGKNVILMFILITMLFSGGLIPYYLLIRNTLRIQNTYLVYILSGLLSAFNVFIVKGYYQGIPYEIYESATIDGANDFVIFTRMYAPLSKPIYATIALWVAVGKWNDYMTGLLYVDNQDLYLIQNTLRNMIVTATSTSGIGGDASQLALSDSIKMATVVISLIPIMLVYPFVQKYFTKGVMLGSVKG